MKAIATGLRTSVGVMALIPAVSQRRRGYTSIVSVIQTNQTENGQHSHLQTIQSCKSAYGANL